MNRSVLNAKWTERCDADDLMQCVHAEILSFLIFFFVAISGTISLSCLPWCSYSPDVCKVVMVVVVITVVDVVVEPPSWEAEGLLLFFRAVSHASSILTEDGAVAASTGKTLHLWDWLPCGLFSLPLLFGITWVVRESVVGSTLSAPLVFSFDDFFWGRETGNPGVVGENVVNGDVAAAVAVVAMSEKAGASSWGTSWVTVSPAFSADIEPGMVGYASTEPSFLKKCWSPWKSLVSRCSWSIRPLRTGWWLGMLTGEAVVTAWTSLSVSCVDECVIRSLPGPSVLLLIPSLEPES